MYFVIQVARFQSFMTVQFGLLIENLSSVAEEILPILRHRVCSNFRVTSHTELCSDISRRDYRSHFVANCNRTDANHGLCCTKRNGNWQCENFRLIVSHAPRVHLPIMHQWICSSIACWTTSLRVDQTNTRSGWYWLNASNRTIYLEKSTTETFGSFGLAQIEKI